jgi:5-methylcytosine-specific restriction endonuclease McrA
MARIRTIKPEFWADEKLSPLSPLDRLVFLGLISMSDDAGRIIDSVRAIDGFIFPATEDTCRESLDRLVTLERIDRGVTGSGQRIIQIANWSKHQRIDKPNTAAAFPPIVVLEESSTRRRKITVAVCDFVWERDQGVCQKCGKALRRDKVDRYDAGADLGEIDHIEPFVDGGTNDPQNLQLLCLPCNRAKAGEAVRRRNQEQSTNDLGSVEDSSAPRSTTNDPDLRPTKTTGAHAPVAPKYPHFTKASCDQLYDAWTKFGKPPYSSFRSAFGPLFGERPDHPLPDVLAAIREAISRAEREPYTASNLTPRSFVSRLGYWIGEAKGRPAVDPATGIPLAVMR